MRKLDIKIGIEVPDIVQQPVIKALVALLHGFFSQYGITLDKLDVEVEDVK